MFEAYNHEIKEDMKNIRIFVLDMTITGGVERVASNMSIYFSKFKDDYTVEIVSIFKKNATIPYPIPENVKVKYLCPNNYYSLDNFIKKIKSNLIMLYSLIIESFKFGKEDIIISNMANISDFLSLLKFRNRYKLICFEHTYHAAFGKFSQLVIKTMLKNADFVVTLTNSEKDYYKQYFKKVICIPNALTFYPAKCATFLSKRVVAIGRLSVEKGFTELLPIYENLAKKYPDWEFAIFGSGCLESVLKNKMNNYPINVKLYPSTNIIQQEMLNSSIYVCSSLTEAFPMVMLEAMACGLPVVSYDCPCGPREIIKNGEDGILVPERNTILLEQAIEKMILDEYLWQSFSKATKSNIKRFLPDTIFNKWIELINNVSDESTNSSSIS